MRLFQVTKNQQNWLSERPGIWSVVISSLKFDNKSFWNYSKISVPKMFKIVVSLSLKKLIYEISISFLNSEQIWSY